jgi:DNA repair protein RecO (recombination protein O)
MAGGGIVCDTCGAAAGRRLSLARGTIKQLNWIQGQTLDKALRLQFSEQALAEGLALCEAFVPYHLGKEPRSLNFLRQMRKK